jgi:hypothetical protein
VHRKGSTTITIGEALFGLSRRIKKQCAEEEELWSPEEVGVNRVFVRETMCIINQVEFQVTTNLLKLERPIL